MDCVQTTQVSDWCGTTPSSAVAFVRASRTMRSDVISDPVGKHGSTDETQQ